MKFLRKNFIISTLNYENNYTEFSNFLKIHAEYCLSSLLDFRIFADV